MSGGIGRIAELPHQQHPGALRIEGQDDRAVAAVVGLARLRLPTPVAAAIVEHRLLQHRPVVGQDFFRADTDAIFHGELHAAGKRYRRTGACAILETD